MTQWKSKLSLSDNSSPLDESSKSKLKLGLFSYPVLQAADILVHRYVISLEQKCLGAGQEIGRETPEKLWAYEAL